MKKTSFLEIKKNFVKHLSNIKIEESWDYAVRAMTDCKYHNGKIVTSGMGKAGHAMRKFSSTLCSLGFPSCFLHPGEASHGDLGLICKNDLLFVASTSGKTREILEIINLCKTIKLNTVIGITSHPDSYLIDKCDIVLNMGEIKEPGHLGMAPTASILVMLAICDSLALVASENIGYSLKEYGEHHHGGYIGEICRKENNPRK